MAARSKTVSVHAFFISLSFTITITITTALSKDQSFHINLIHRDSPLSPFYNPNTTLFDRATWAFQSSISRHAYLSGVRRINDDFEGEVESDGGEYLVKFSIGTPPVEILAILDTGSDLIWTQCLPCESCYEQPSPIFDPSKSSTYTNLTCESPHCTLLPIWNCDSSNLCHYMYTYADWSYTQGSLATEVLTFETSDEGTFSFSDVVFGCGHNNANTSPGRDAGILGLGYRNLSLISQMQSIAEPKFSYCFGNRSNELAKSHLVLGKFSDGYTNTTPLEIIDNRYSLLLEGISVGMKRLGIPPDTFKPKPSGNGGVIIDTGTVLSFLARDGYDRLVEALEEGLELESDSYPDPPYERCYTGSLSGLAGYERVTFHFASGMDVFLDRWSLFLQVKEEEFCLAVLPASLGAPSVLGNLFQQFYSVGYDLVGKVVSFTSMECGLVE